MDHAEGQDLRGLWRRRRVRGTCRISDGLRGGFSDGVRALRVAKSTVGRPRPEISIFEGRERGRFDSTHPWQPERVPHFEKEGRAEDVVLRVYEGELC